MSELGAHSKHRLQGRCTDSHRNGLILVNATKASLENEHKIPAWPCLGLYSETALHIGMERIILFVHGADTIAEVKLLIFPFLR